MACKMSQYITCLENLNGGNGFTYTQLQKEIKEKFGCTLGGCEVNRLFHVFFEKRGKLWFRNSTPATEHPYAVINAAMERAFHQPNGGWLQPQWGDPNSFAPGYPMPPWKGHETCHLPI